MTVDDLISHLQIAKETSGGSQKVFFRLPDTPSRTNEIPIEAVTLSAGRTYDCPDLACSHQHTELIIILHDAGTRAP